MLNRVLWGIVIFGGIATVAGVFPLALEGRYGIVTLYMMCYVTIIGISVFKSLGYEIRALACLAVNYAIGLSEFYFFGISELSYAFMYSFVIFSGVLFGFRTGLGAITLVICSISIEYWHGMYQKAIRSGLTLDVAGILADWLSAMLTFSFLMLLSLAVISAMLQLLERSLADSNELVKNLRREVADRESAQQSLLKSERLYRLLADNVHDIIWTTDLYGNLTYVSPAMERMCGFTPEECIAGGIDVNGPPENTELFMTEVAKALAQEDKEPLASDLSRTFEIELYHKDGGTIDAEIVTVLLRNEENQPTGILGVTRNLAERKLLEQQLYQAQKMEAVGQLAGGVAHDFNNLLQVIQGYNEIALQTSANHVETHESLVQVQLATNRATTLVRQLLAFSRKQLLILEDIDLSATVSDLAKMIQRVIGERIAFDIISDTGLKSVHVDKGQIEQVLMNLCVNARDAMPDGGTLTIETGTADLDEEFCRANDWAKPGEFVVLRVSDTGCGIDEETKRHIYEPFFTTKQVGKGTGLGLSTVFGIVRQHKGTIEVQSELGVGTTFKLYLPRLHDATTDPKEPEVTRPVGGTETILLADDDTAVLTFGTALLEKAGYTVLAAADGKEAIDVLDTHGSKVDLTILDVVMPELDGKAVYEHIQMRWPHIPVLFVSGHNAEGKHADFILQKGTHFIHKPYEGDVVLQKNARTPRYGAIAEVSRSPVIQIATSAHLRPIPSPSLRLTLLPVP